MKAKVDQKLCVGCGFCVYTASEAFQLNKAGKAEAKSEISSSAADAVKAAMEGCLAKAIKEVQ